MSQKSMQSARARGKRKPRNQKALALPHPPSLKGIEIEHHVVLRFTTTAAVGSPATQITFSNLGNTIVVAITSSTGYALFTWVKVKRVRLWASALLGASSTVSVVFGQNNSSSISGDTQIHTDTSMGVEPAYVDAVPQKGSLNASWQYIIGNAQNAFALNGPAGMIVDVHLSMRGSYGGPGPNSQAISGATVGVQYLRGLDGLALASTNFPPAYPIGNQ